MMQPRRLLGSMRVAPMSNQPQHFKCGFCGEALTESGQEVEAKIVQRLLSWLGDFRTKYPDVGDLPVSQHWCQMCFGLSASIMQNLFDLGERLQSRAVASSSSGNSCIYANTQPVVIDVPFQNKAKYMEVEDATASKTTEQTFPALSNSVSPAQAFQAGGGGQMMSPLFPNLSNIVESDTSYSSPESSTPKTTSTPAHSRTSTGSFQMQPFLSLPNKPHQNGTSSPAAAGAAAKFTKIAPATKVIPKMEPPERQAPIPTPVTSPFMNGLNMLGKKIKKKYYKPKKSRPEYQCMVCGQMLCSKNWLENHLKKHGITDPKHFQTPPVAPPQDNESRVINIAPLPSSPGVGSLDSSYDATSASDTSMHDLSTTAKDSPLNIANVMSLSAKTKFMSPGSISALVPNLPESLPQLKNKWGKTRKKDIAVFQCPICSRRLRSAAWLENHMKKHLEVNAMECPICQRNFTDRKNFRRHYRLHMENSPYSCVVCGKKSGRNKDLKNHMKQHTLEMENKICPLCKLIHETYDDLITHLEDEHPKYVTALTKPIDDDEAGSEDTEETRRLEEWIGDGDEEEEDEEPYEDDEVEQGEISRGVKRGMDNMDGDGDGDGDDDDVSDSEVNAKDELMDGVEDENSNIDDELDNQESVGEEEDSNTGMDKEDEQEEEEEEEEDEIVDDQFDKNAEESENGMREGDSEQMEDDTEKVQSADDDNAGGD